MEASELRGQTCPISVSSTVSAEQNSIPYDSYINTAVPSSASRPSSGLMKGTAHGSNSSIASDVSAPNSHRSDVSLVSPRSRLVDDAASPAVQNKDDGTEKAEDSRHCVATSSSKDSRKHNQIDIAPLSPNRVSSVYEDVYNSLHRAPVRSVPSSKPVVSQQSGLLSPPVARLADLTSPKVSAAHPISPSEYYTSYHAQIVPSAPVVFRPTPMKFSQQEDKTLLMYPSPVQPESAVVKHPYSSVANHTLRPTYYIQTHDRTREIPSASTIQQRLQGLDYPAAIYNTDVHMPVAVPNTGTVILNHGQLQAAAGSLDPEQLAGLMIIPLKRTASVSTQTDFREDARSRSDRFPATDVDTASVQTEIHMRHITHVDPRANVEVFPKYESLDALFECVICGDALPHEVEYDEHMIQRHLFNCEKCLKALPDQPRYTEHIAECGIHLSQLRCESCSEMFVTLKNLNWHRIHTHRRRMPYRCGICALPFENHQAVSDHISTHQKTKDDHTCLHCNKVFRSETALSRHIPRHKIMQILHECNICGVRFSNGSSLRSHKAHVHYIPQSESIDGQRAEALSDAQYKQRSSDYRGAGFRHSSSASLDTGSGSASCFLQSSDENVHAFKRDNVKAHHAFACSSCHHVSRSLWELETHYKQEHERSGSQYRDGNKSTGDRKLAYDATLSVTKCPFCSAIVTSTEGLTAHIKEMHASEMQVDIRPRTGAVEEYSCSKCDLTFPLEKHLLNHRSVVHGETPFQCNDCQLTFETFTELEAHMQRQHANIPRFVAGDNLEKFQSSSGVRIRGKDQDEESNLHVDVLNISCEECSMEFPDETTLKNHMGDLHRMKPFVCEICDARFAQSLELTWHRKSCLPSKKRRQDEVGQSHDLNEAGTSQREYLGNGFSDNDSMRSASYRSDMTCFLCKHSFHNPSALREHMRMHEMNSMDYVCHICRAVFKVLEQYQIHMSGHVGKEINGPHMNMDLAENPLRIDTSQKLGRSISDGERHALSSSDMTSPRCNVCDDVFASFTALKRHRRDNHQESELSSVKKSASLPSSPVFPVSDNCAFQKVSPSASLPFQPLERSANSSLGSVDGFVSVDDPPFDDKTGEYFCTICHKTTKSATGMKTHYGRCHGIWGKTTTHQEPLTMDNGQLVMRKSRDLWIWPCTHCKKELNTFPRLRAHMMRIHKVNIDKSQVQPKSRFPSALSRPLIAPQSDTVNGEGMSPKSSEGDVALSNGSQEDSSAQSRRILKYQCLRCKSSFNTSKAVRIHSFKRHGVILSKKELHRSKLMSTTIPDTLSSTLSKPQFQRKKGRDLIGQRAPCENCGRVFGNYRALFTHIRQAHRLNASCTSVSYKPSRTEIVASESPIAVGTKVESASNSRHNSDMPEKLNDSDMTRLPATESTKENEDSDSATPSSSCAPSVECPVCGKKFFQQKSVMAHMSKAHQIYKDSYADFWPNGLPELPRVSSNCPICARDYIDERAMRIHIFKAHKMHYKDLDLTKPFPLEAPSAAPHNRPKVIRSEQTLPVPSATTKQPRMTETVCPECNADLVDESSFLAHLREVHNYSTDRINAFYSGSFPNGAESAEHDGMTPSDVNAYHKASLNNNARGIFRSANDLPLSSRYRVSSVKPYGYRNRFVKRRGGLNRRRPPQRRQYTGRKERYQCPQCDNAFVSIHAVRVHVGRAHGKGLLSQMSWYFDKLTAASREFDGVDLQPNDSDYHETSIADPTRSPVANRVSPDPDSKPDLLPLDEPHHSLATHSPAEQTQKSASPQVLHSDALDKTASVLHNRDLAVESGFSGKPDETSQVAKEDDARTSPGDDTMSISLPPSDKENNLPSCDNVYRDVLKCDAVSIDSNVRNCESAISAL